VLSPTSQGVILSNSLIFSLSLAFFVLTWFSCWSVQTLKRIFLLGEFELSFESIQGSILSGFCFLCGFFAFWILRSGIWWEISEFSFGTTQESELGIWRSFVFLWSWLSLGFVGWTEQRKGYVFLLLNLSSIGFWYLLLLEGLICSMLVSLWIIQGYFELECWVSGFGFEVLGFVWSFEWFFFTLWVYRETKYLVCRNSWWLRLGYTKDC